MKKNQEPVREVRTLTLVNPNHLLEQLLAKFDISMYYTGKVVRQTIAQVVNNGSVQTKSDKK